MLYEIKRTKNSKNEIIDFSNFKNFNEIEEYCNSRKIYSYKKIILEKIRLSKKDFILNLNKGK